jgi:hypothetical protein
MSLSQKIAAALDAYSGECTLPSEIVVEEGGHQLSLAVTSGGPVGVAFDALTYTAPSGVDRPAEAIRSWAERIAAKVTYLMEPLVLLEYDALAGEAELRSQSPTARGERRAYYEARLRKEGSLKLTRVVADVTTRRRRSAPCQLTREALERLADDLVACAG